MNEWDWDTEGNEYVDRLLRKILPELLQKVESALQEVFQYARYFISFNELTRFVMSALEKHVRLSEKTKELIFEELKKIYEKTQQDMELPIKPELTIQDLRTIEYAKSLHDFYLGKFFQGDKQLRLEVLKWMSKYYLEGGNPIGRGQEGIKKFLDEFGSYLKQRTENKARQIIDTSVNHLRNSARLRAMARAKIQKYRWDAVGDRLTCPYCRSMDGRIFDSGEAIRTLELIETDPSALPQVKPFLTTMPLEKLKATSSSRLPSKMPPSHPHCRCRIVASIIEESYPIAPTLEIAHEAAGSLLDQLRNELKALSPRELTEKIKAHLGSDWRRQSGGRWDEEKKHLLKHIQKHTKKLNLSPEQYEKLPYEIMKNPDNVYIQKRLEGKSVETDYIFIKGRIVVVSSDDWLGIKSCYPLKEEYNNYIEKVEDDIQKGQIIATIRAV
mgnify:CR=1 FL=1